MEVVQSKLFETFDKCQERRNNLTKVAETLKKFYLKIKDHPEERKFFIEKFLFYVECLLQESSRDSGIERCVHFIAIFSAFFADTCDEEENTKQIFNSEENLYNYIISLISKPEIHCHSNKTIRFRVCQLMQHLLGAVPQNAALDEDLMDGITKVMLDRIQDKIPMVRAQAARSLNRLQQPSIKDCPVINAYLFHMACDDSPLVRSAALSNISLTTKTLPCVLDRTRDVSENVRILAFQVISQKVSIKALNSSQRLYLIKQGLLDRSKAVQEVVKKQLFQAWLLTFDANLLDLLKKLDVVGAYDTCCKAVTAMFDCSPVHDLMDGFTLLNENKMINIDELTPESALYWHQLCHCMRKKGPDGDQYLDALLPSALTFAHYMETYFDEILGPFMTSVENKLTPEQEDDKIEKEFVAEQLVKIAVKMDLSDNAGRQKLNQVFRKAITALDILCFPCLIPPLAAGLLELLSCSSSITDEETNKVELIADLIATTREPHDLPADHVIMKDSDVFRIKEEFAKISVFLNEANEELQANVAKKDFAKAGILQEQIDEAKSKKDDLEKQLNPTIPETDVTISLEKSDTGTLVKCLILVKEVLSSIFECRFVPNRTREKGPRGIHPTLLQLLDTLVIPSVLCQSPEVRRQAVRCLGVGCMFSSVLAARHFNLLMQVSQADHYVVRVAAINALNDLIRMFGVQVLTTNKETKQSDLEEDGSDSSNHSVVSEDSITDISQSIMDKFLEMLDEKVVRKGDFFSHLITKNVLLVQKTSSGASLMMSVVLTDKTLELEIRIAAASLLSCVLISHRILSPAVVSRLVLLWYDPGTRDEPNLLNIVSSFLDLFPYISKEAHECVQACLLPVLRVLFNAPASSPYASINVSNVAELIVNITAPTIVEKADLTSLGISRDINWLNDWSAHDDFAIMISNQILADPTSAYVNTLSKILCNLDLNPHQSDNLRDLQVLTSNMMQEVKDKQAIRQIRKFQTQLSSVAKLGNSISVLKTDDNQPKQDEPADSSILKSINFNPATPVSSQTGKISDLFKNPLSAGNPKRNLSSAFVNVSD